MIRTRGLICGALLTIGAKALLNRLLLLKFESDVRALNSGDYGPLLSAYADDAVLRFNEGDHRWAGDHQGLEAIEEFLRDFTGAGLQGEIIDIWSSGPPWSLTLIARFDDHAHGPDGEPIYANRVMMLIRTRWGKIVEHEDFYMDTARIDEFEAKLTQLGIEPASG